MKIHRFIVDFNPQDEVIEISDEEVVTQISKILRLKVGEKLWLFDGKQTEVLGVINMISKDKVEVAVEEVVKNINEPEVRVTLYCAILKKENFELVVQKATEIGVAEIVPVITKRTVKLNLNHERLEKIVKEAVEQSGRGMIPNIHEPMEFEEALRQAQGKQNLFFDQSGAELKPKTSNLKPVAIWIGPEGGWDESEMQLAKEHNFDMVSLGKTTLRGETAAIVASYLVTHGS